MLITIDSGSTNTRCRLFLQGKFVDEVRYKVGSRNTVKDGNTKCIEEVLKRGIHELLMRHNLEESDVEAVISSGTLASDVGIHTIPHVLAPAGVQESAQASELVKLEHITNIPILFIPGIKILPVKEEQDEERIIELLDSMSGEECETYGISAMMGLKGEYVITLPGSYNKALQVDEKGRIVSMRTGMCGEFIAAIAENTILRHSLPEPVIRELIPEKLIQGYDYCARHGVSPSIIKARMVRFLCEWSADEAANFYVGAILYDDIKSVAEICTNNKPVIVGGSNPLRGIFMILLAREGVENLVEIDDECARLAPSIGAINVYKTYKSL